MFFVDQFSSFSLDFDQEYLIVELKKFHFLNWKTPHLGFLWFLWKTFLLVARLEYRRDVGHLQRVKEFYQSLPCTYRLICVSITLQHHCNDSFGFQYDSHDETIRRQSHRLYTQQRNSWRDYQHVLLDSFNLHDTLSFL